MEEIKSFLDYMVVGFDIMRQENKSDYSKMTAKKLKEDTWLAIIMYDKKQAQKKANEILSNLELV